MQIQNLQYSGIKPHIHTPVQWLLHKNAKFSGKASDCVEHNLETATKIPVDLNRYVLHV